MEKKPQLYTPAQVGWGTFIGGPILAVNVLYANFVALGRHEEARRTLWIGVSLATAFFAVIWFLPAKYTRGWVTVGYSMAAHQIARTQQMRKDEILASDTFEKRSTWWLIVRSVGFLLGTVVLFLLAASLLEGLGLEPLDHKPTSPATP
jgi:hypothetical protein